MILADATGAWAGTNGFRLMPADELAESPATTTVSTAAGGALTSVAYTWQHPDDGPQDGLRVVWATGEGDAAAAVWGDSWHQKPEPATLTGTHAGDAAVELAMTYAGTWGWRILLDATDAQTLRLRMENVVPEEQADADTAAGPYPVMVMDLHRG